MPIEPRSLRSLLESKVVLHPAARILMAAVVVAGGLAFAGFGLLMLLRPPPRPFPHPVGAAILLVTMVAMGVGFVWIGLRLMRARADSGALLSPVARVRCSLIVGALSVATVAAAAETGEALHLATAAALLVFSYWLYPPEQGGGGA